MTTKKAEVQDEEAPDQASGEDDRPPGDEGIPVEEPQEAPYSQQQMVPPTVPEDTRGKFHSDPNWYPDPDKPLPRGF